MPGCHLTALGYGRLFNQFITHLRRAIADAGRRRLRPRGFRERQSQHPRHRDRQQRQSRHRNPRPHLACKTADGLSSTFCVHPAQPVRPGTGCPCQRHAARGPRGRGRTGSAVPTPGATPLPRLGAPGQAHTRHSTLSYSDAIRVRRMTVFACRPHTCTRRSPPFHTVSASAPAAALCVRELSRPESPELVLNSGERSISALPQLRIELTTFGRAHDKTPRVHRGGPENPLRSTRAPSPNPESEAN